MAYVFFIKLNFTDKSDSENESTVVKPKHNKRKSNPNVQSTGTGVKKSHQNIDDKDDEESVTVSYKSDRTAVPKGPSDQGATATLVSIK